MKYFLIEPEVSGELGDKTIMDTSIHPPVIKNLHFVFNGWLGDDIIACFPVFLISEGLKKYLSNSNFSGFLIEACQIDISEDFFLLQPNTVLPGFYWLKIIGKKGDDCFITNDNILALEEHVLNVMKEKFIIINAVISPCLDEFAS